MKLQETIRYGLIDRDDEGPRCDNIPSFGFAGTHDASAWCVTAQGFHLVLTFRTEPSITSDG
jgi:hypothetical protein